MTRLLTIFGALMAIAAAPSASLVRPLSDADQARIQEMGCESAFTVGPRTYLFLMNSRMVVRTASGASVCGVDDTSLDAFLNGGRPVSCGGVSLLLKHTGRHVANNESDSVSGPSTLTITRGAVRQRLRGISGTAC